MYLTWTIKIWLRLSVWYPKFKATAPRYSDRRSDKCRITRLGRLVPSSTGTSTHPILRKPACRQVWLSNQVRHSIYGSPVFFVVYLSQILSRFEVLMAVSYGRLSRQWMLKFNPERSNSTLTFWNRDLSHRSCPSFVSRYLWSRWAASSSGMGNQHDPTNAPMHRKVSSNCSLWFLNDVT